jgi:hypothetical protein
MLEKKKRKKKEEGNVRNYILFYNADVKVLINL